MFTSTDQNSDLILSIFDLQVPPSAEVDISRVPNPRRTTGLYGRSVTYAPESPALPAPFRWENFVWENPRWVFECWIQVCKDLDVCPWDQPNGSWCLLTHKEQIACKKWPLDLSDCIWKKGSLFLILKFFLLLIEGKVVTYRVKHCAEIEITVTQHAS